MLKYLASHTAVSSAMRALLSVLGPQFARWAQNVICKDAQQEEQKQP
jgi:hypothetical protein